MDTININDQSESQMKVYLGKLVISHPALHIQGTPHLGDGLGVKVLLDHKLYGCPPALMLTSYLLNFMEFETILYHMLHS